MIASLRATLALIVLAGVYLLALSVLLIWLTFAVLGVWSLGSPEARFNTGPLLTVAATFMPVMLFVREVVAMSRPTGPRPDSVRLYEDEAPGLRRAVAELADAVGTAAPHEIRLVPDVNAFVTDDDAMLGLHPGRRRLYIGAPLLVGLRPDELRAIICHELGHFARRHAWFTGPAFRGSAALERAKAHIREAEQSNQLIRWSGGVVYLTVSAYAAIVNWLVLPIRRRQELEADRIAASVAGPDALADALCSVAAIASAWVSFEQDFLMLYRKASGTIPNDPYRAFAAMLDDPDCREPLAEARLLAVEQPALPGDPHPRLVDRVASLSNLPPALKRRDAAIPVIPLDIADPVFVRLAATRSRGKRVPWRDWLAGLAEYRATLVLTPLARAAREVAGGRDEPTLETILGLLDGHRAMELARALDPGGARDWRARELLATAVYTLIGQALVRRKAAHWTMGWTGPSRLVTTEADPADIAHWVSTAIDDPGQVPWLRMHLHAIHIDAAAVPITGEHATQSHQRKGRTVKLTPAIPESTRSRHRSLAYATLAVLLSLFALGGLSYLAQDDPPPRYQPRPWSTPTQDAYQLPPILPTGQYPRPLPSRIWPSIDVPLPLPLRSR